MNWYNGDIANAITESKTKKLIFLVYAFDSNSNEMNDVWDKESISTLCNQNCVSLKLDSESQPCKQFTQIYSVNTYPTTYLIGNNGRPLEVIVGSVTEEGLLARIQKGIDAHYLSIKPEQTPASTSSAAAAVESETVSDNKEEDNEKNETGESQKSIEERVALAKEKLRLIQEKKKAEDEERERNSEMERRKLGQEILKAKREKEEQELRKIAEEKRKEKLEDELAKQRIKERIQQDREEKQKKYAKEKEELENSKKTQLEQQELARQQQAQAESARLSQIARIQFRFVDGSSVNQQFDPNQTLEEARSFVADKLKERNESQSFSLHSSFPKREYTSADMSKTLRDLQLAPSASLLVIPIKSKAAKTFERIIPTSTGTTSSTGTSTVATYANDILSLLFLPVTIIWGLVTSLFGLSGTGANANQQGPRRDAPATSTSPLRQDPNLRRRNNLNGNNRNDDDNATWNGNSTQQM